MTETVADLHERDFVNSLARGLSLIRALDRDHPRMTLSEVAERAGMNRAAARRFLHTLVPGYDESDRTCFRLHPKYSSSATQRFRR